VIFALRASDISPVGDVKESASLTDCKRAMKNEL